MRISIVGTGNIGTHLAKVLHANSHEILGIHNRTSSNGLKLAEELDVDYINNIDTLISLDNELIILAIPDDSIATFSEKLEKNDCLIAHTSGSVGMECLHPIKRIAVFYPLQSFSKHVEMDWLNIPICVEAKQKEDQAILLNLAKSLSSKVYEVDSIQRKQLHLAAVIVNNFTNHLNYKAQEILRRQNLDFEILKPLIIETFKKILSGDIKKAQTGPARRNDTEIMDEHLNMLAQDELMQKIYNLLSESIQLDHGQ